MDKGIRPATIAKFRELLPTRVNTREGNTSFRKTVMASIMEDFGISLASAATHYNHAFIDARTASATDTALTALLAGLGRPEDKKGGRKKKAATPATPAVIPTPVNALLQNFIAAGAVPQPAAIITAAAAQVGLESLLQGSDDAPKTEDGVVLLSEGIKENTATQTVSVNEVPVQKFSVRKVSDGTVVCSDLTLDEANALIAKAAQAKKAKLELVA